MFGEKVNKRDHRRNVERSILHGLVCEWEAALWMLCRDHRKRMRKPLFTLKDMESRLGSWCPDKREISLNRKLALHHSWDAVVEILLHEMAHQMADEVLHAGHEHPHGPTFQRACRLLRANPKASGTSTPLDKRILNGDDPAEDKLAARIRKLMALGESCNRHEAESAMAKAHQLMTKYQLSHVTDAPDNGFVSVFLGKPKLRHMRDAYCLANLLQDFYYVYGIWVSAYVLGKEKMGRVLEISGTMQNVQTAGYIFDFVNRFVDRHWAQYNKKRKLTLHRKTDFAVGIIEGFRSTLVSKQSVKKAPKSALIKQADTMLTAYVSHRYPRTVQFKRSASRHDADIYEDGISIGKRLVVAEGIGRTSTTKQIGYKGGAP
jgi:hypothetical protein